MRFLENMVSDMVKQSTGFNPKRVIRMIGGKNILMAGAGAVLAGTLAGAANSQSSGSSSGSAFDGPPPRRPDAPPPPLPNLPPIPGSAGPPPVQGAPPLPQAPPPPLPTASASPPPPLPTDIPAAAEPAAAEESFDPQVVFAVVRTMVGAALADGHLSPKEKEAIQGRLSESGLDDDQVRQIHQDLVLPPSPGELAKMTDDAATRETLYRFAALVVVTDDEIADLERRWLDRLATAFEMSEERRQALEEETLGAVQS